MPAAPFPWDEAIGLGLGVLRLSPDAFWRTTPRELALALRARGFGLAATIDRAALDDLMRRHPDG
ncbi:hypothetical protein CCR97_20575 [Rhodoplanes elegans]|uniref:Phage tail assembly chaperone n=1 Tax=Rhodoplanes elegans TaxID=29408 RepID=A0A327KFD1_9BRAD|nr:rcc01693 family protein [Rhodoplanes elegans]MBK5960575.1 hypothetical protein [Rhodoplanes elegans]RAI36831.1 hypothetical protein CH338_17030 [Rhodoplanes elegans]